MTRTRKKNADVRRLRALRKLRKIPSPDQRQVREIETLMRRTQHVPEEVRRAILKD
jgi:hypothetical protein